MTNEERDAIIVETHTIVKAQKKQIVTLFEGYNQTNKNSTMIKVIAVIGGFIGTTCVAVTGWFVTRN